MKKIEAIIRPYKVEIIKNEFTKIGIGAMTVSNVEGFGNQRGHVEVYRDTEVCVSLIPKAKIEVVLEDDKVEDAVNILLKFASSGQTGDGKIFVIPAEDVIRIRTGERGKEAL